MRRNLFLFIFVTLLTFHLSANPLAKIYRNNDPIFQTIELLSNESKMNSVSSTGPLSGYELYEHLTKINISLLPDDSIKLYSSILETLNNPYKGKVWGYQLDVTQEGFLNTNNQFKYYELAEKYNDRKPFLYGDIESVFGSSGFAIVSYAYPKAFVAENFSGWDSNNPLFPKTPEQYSVPHTAFISISNPNISFIFGRDTFKYGRGMTGNLMIGNHVPYYDFLQLSMHNRKVKYSFLAIPMNELVSAEILYDIYGGDWEDYLDLLGTAYYPHNQPIGYWHTLFHNSLRRTYIAHRAEIDIFPWWRLIFTEGTLFYTNTTDLRMFSPLMFLHNNQNFGEVNNSLGFETEFTLSKRWALDIQIFLDQIQTKGEQSTDDEIPPNSYAFLLNARYNYPLNNWRVKGYIESVYTSPYVYLRTGDETSNYGNIEEGTFQYNLDFVHAVSMRDGISGVNWLGYVYGPDSIVLATETTATYKENLGITANLRFIVQGESGLKIEGKSQEVKKQLAKNINILSPSGENPTFRLIGGLGLSYKVPKVKLTFYLRNYWLNQWYSNTYKSGYQLTFGASYKI